MSTPYQSWQKLVSAARQAPDERDLSLSYGFSTRVAALAMQTPSAPSLQLHRLSLRALGVAGLLMLATIAANAGPILTALHDEAEALSDQTITADVIDLS